MLHILTVALAHVQGGDTSENVLNESCQKLYSFYQAK